MKLSELIEVLSKVEGDPIVLIPYIQFGTLSQITNIDTEVSAGKLNAIDTVLFEDNGEQYKPLVDVKDNYLLIC